jgi:hypothetical protein
VKDVFSALQGWPRWCDRFGQYGIKVSSITLKIVTLVENHPQKRLSLKKRIFRLAEFTPSEGRGGN